MANLLKMAVIDTILTLRARGWSGRRIADTLGIHRDTVARYLRQAAEAPKPAIAPTGSPAEAEASKPAIAPTGSETLAASALEPARAGRPSDCEPWRAVILAKLELGLSAQRICQDLHADHGATVSYYSVRRFVAQVNEPTELPVRRLECGPGEEVQVDFGTGAPLLLPDGSRRRTHVFRIVLSHSRKAYSEVILRQTTDAFLHCLENAFQHFGGVPQRIVLDNLRAAVT